MAKHDSDDRYIAVGPEANYVDENQTILVNKLGICDLHSLHVKEEEGLVHCYQTMVQSVRFDTPLSNGLIREVHRLVFGDLFEWAGKWRHSWISKGNTVWAHPDHIDALMQGFEVNVLQQTPLSKTMSDDEFCSIVALIQGEFLTIHPFREGNARTIKVVTDLYAVQTDRPFLIYDESETGKQDYIDAAIQAMLTNHRPLEAIVKAALATARSKNGTVDQGVDETPDSTEASLR